MKKSTFPPVVKKVLDDDDDDALVRAKGARVKHRFLPHLVVGVVVVVIVVVIIPLLSVSVRGSLFFLRGFGVKKSG